MPDRPAFEKMTTQELADWCAEDAGWNRYTASNGIVVWDRGGFSPELGTSPYEQAKDHPFPLTLDGAAAAMPEGIRTFKSLPTRDGWDVWYDGVSREHLIIASVPDTGNEIHDRFRLAAECRWAGREKQ